MVDNYLITWFYAEHSGDESFYPSVGGNTSSRKFQEVYWKCVYDFFKSFQITDGKDTVIKKMFFTNVSSIPTDVGGVDINDYFNQTGVKVVQLELTNKTHMDWHGAWRNQFYLFDILEYLNGKDGNYLILDSDCIIRGSLLPIFEDIKKRHIITYDCGYDVNHDINGIRITEMQELYKEFYSSETQFLSYKGGEFVGVSGKIIDKLLSEYKYLWKVNYRKYEEKKVKLNEEAHFLSMIYCRLGVNESVANKYIKRMWTSVKYDNISSVDSKLVIWHMPAEKKYGFLKLFDWLKKKNREMDEYMKYSSNLFSIPGNIYMRRLKKIVWKISEKIKCKGNG